MSSATIEIYNTLVAAGIDKEKAEHLASEILTKTEAKEVLATKADLVAMKTSIVQWVAALLVAQAAAIVALQELVG